MKYSSSRYPTFARSKSGVVLLAAMNGYESPLTGTGPVAFGRGVAPTAKTSAAIAPNIDNLLQREILRLAESCRIRAISQFPVVFSHMTLSCPHVHLALISNSFTPLGVALGLCS